MARKKDKPKKANSRPDKPTKTTASIPPTGSPKDLAQLLLQEANQSPDAATRTDLASKALALDADAIEAYLILAQHARTRKEAQQLYEQAVATFERTPEVEPGLYLRARLGLAHVLWTGGQ